MGRLAGDSSGITHKSQDIKKYSNLFISKAAMNIIGKKFPYESIVNSEMLSSYESVLTEALRSGEVPLGFSLALLKRRKNFDKPEEEIKESDMHNSKSLWRKWGDVKTMIKKTFIPIYKEIVPIGASPTDEQLEAVLHAIRAAEERTTARATKKEKLIAAAVLEETLDIDGNLIPLPMFPVPVPQPRMKKINSNWTPTEWLTFMKLGPPAGPDFAKAFGGKKLRGKKRKNGCVPDLDLDVQDAFSGAAASAASCSSSSIMSDRKESDASVETDDSLRKPSKITNKYLSSIAMNPKDTKKQRKLASAELAIYRYNVALQARKDRIEEIRELINLEDKVVEKKKFSADLKNLLSTPPPVAPENLPVLPSEPMEESSDSDDSGEDE